MPASLPAAAGERSVVFAAAVHFCQAHPDPEAFHWTLASLIAQFHAQVSPDLVREGIDCVLAEAAHQDAQFSGGTAGMTTVSAGNTTVEFHSSVDHQLFAVAPVLHDLDPAKANALLAKHPEVAAYLKRFPRGVVSCFTPSYTPPANVIVPDRRKPQGILFATSPQGQLHLTALDLGLEFAPANSSLCRRFGSGFRRPLFERPGTRSP